MDIMVLLNVMLYAIFVSTTHGTWTFEKMNVLQQVCWRFAWCKLARWFTYDGKFAWWSHCVFTANIPLCSWNDLRHGQLGGGWLTTKASHLSAMCVGRTVKPSGCWIWGSSTSLTMSHPPIRRTKRPKRRLAKPQGRSNSLVNEPNWRTPSTSIYRNCGFICNICWF